MTDLEKAHARIEALEAANRMLSGAITAMVRTGMTTKAAVSLKTMSPEEFEAKARRDATS